MNEPIRPVHYMERKIRAQEVIDRIIVHGHDYLDKLIELNEQFPADRSDKPMSRYEHGYKKAVFETKMTI